MKAYNINIEDDEKNLIVAGDHQILNELLFQIKKLVSLQSKQWNKNAQGVDLESISEKKDITKTESCLEFLLLSLGKSFSLLPKQAAGLLTDGSQYLAHILIKGLKGQYPQVINWLMEIYSVSKHFTNLMKKEEFKAIIVVLNNLKGGLYSKDKDVAKWTVKNLQKIVCDFDNEELSESMYSWFVAINGGLEGTVYCIQKHPDVQKEALELLLCFGQQKSFDMFSKYSKNIINDNVEYWRIVSGFLEHLSTLKFENNENLLQFWFENALNIAENETRKSVEERSACISVLCGLWQYFPDFIEKKEALANRLLISLKRGVRDKNVALQHYSLAMGFSLFEDFLIAKRNYASNIYKTLVFTLLETHQQEHLREFLMANLSIVYQDNPAIPVSILVDPYIKLLQFSENTTYFFNIFDFAFLFVLAKHSKLNFQNSLQLVDLIARLYLGDRLFSIGSKKIFITLAASAKIHEDPSGVELIKKFLNVLSND